MNSEDKLKVLKEILLTEEREFDKDILKKIQELKDRQGDLNERVDPILDARLEKFINEIPQTLGPTITQTLKTEIKKSNEELAEALFPILGKMIKKYVQAEIKKLNNNINSKLKKSFSWRSVFKGKNEQETNAAALLKEEYKGFVENVMVIEKGSGILKANYAKTQNIDEDMMAGMLTAIKSFAEDAFAKANLELERIDYELYTIHLQNFSNYYIAVVISGIYDDEFKDKLEDVLLDFAQFVINKDDLDNKQNFTRKLKEYFTDERI
jgi:hypothetical protein